MEAVLFPLFLVAAGTVGAVIVMGLPTIPRVCGAPALGWPWLSLPL
jgi:hypothetical protein